MTSCSCAQWTTQAWRTGAHRKCQRTAWAVLLAVWACCSSSRAQWMEPRPAGRQACPPAVQGCCCLQQADGCRHGLLVVPHPSCHRAASLLSMQGERARQRSLLCWDRPPPARQDGCHPSSGAGPSGVAPLAPLQFPCLAAAQLRFACPLSAMTPVTCPLALEPCHTRRTPAASGGSTAASFQPPCTIKLFDCQLHACASASPLALFYRPAPLSSAQGLSSLPCFSPALFSEVSNTQMPVCPEPWFVASSPPVSRLPGRTPVWQHCTHPSMPPTA